MNRIIVLCAAVIVTLVDPAMSQWSLVSSPTSNHLYDIVFPTRLKGWIVGESGALVRTTDGGTNWILLPSLDVYQHPGISFADSLRGWMTGALGAFFSTTNGGDTWSPNYLTTLPYTAYFYKVRVAMYGSGIRGWAAGGRDANLLGAVYTTTGDGYWTPQVIAFSGRLIGVEALSESLGWVVGEQGLILKTTNGGRWWNQQESGTETSFNSVRFFDPQEGLVAGASGKILRTTDGGENWKTTLNTGNEVFFKIWKHNDSTAYVVGSGPTILRSTDRGETWVRQVVNAPSSITIEGIFFTSPTDGWAVGTYGAILKTVNSGEGKELPAEFGLEQNYPNPFNPTTAVRYQLAAASDVRLVVYDLLGREVAVLVNEKKAAGSYKVQFGASGLSSGVYLYRLTAGGFAQTRKMVVVK
jgi:photosystem II stability/assembly factor-like uncharacterized protein